MNSENCESCGFGRGHTELCRHPDVIAEKVKSRLDYMGVLLAVKTNWKDDVFSYTMTPNRPQANAYQNEMIEATIRAGFELRSWFDPHLDIVQMWTITRHKAKTSCPLFGKWAWCDQTHKYVRVVNE